jgi:hypothetical protein
MMRPISFWIIMIKRHKVMVMTVTQIWRIISSCKTGRNFPLLHFALSNIQYRLVHDAGSCVLTLLATCEPIGLFKSR